MATTVEYGSYIIDLTDAMLENRQALNDEQVQRIRMINRRTVDFLTDYLQHESSSLPELLYYLQSGAPAPLRIIIGCAKMLISGHCGILPHDYHAAMKEVLQCGYAISTEVEDMYRNLRTFMEEMGIEEDSA
jgi:hypothetical protein